MKAVICPKGGPAEVLRLVELPRPAPAEREVLIRIHATTVTSGDVVMRKLRGPLRLVFGLAFGLRKNAFLGHELAGEIEAVGAQVTQFKKGDGVFASTGNKGGAYAEYICLPEDGMLAVKPSNLSFEQAAAVPIGGNTALYLLRKADIQAGQRVLIYGASGSVGSYAVQLAKYFGAEVTGVCSTRNVDMVRSLGASRVIDYSREDISDRGASYDVIFDAVGKLTGSGYKSALLDGGIFLSVKSSTREEPGNLSFLKDRLEAGEIRPVIDRTFALDDIIEAHRYVEAGHKQGNVVIRIT